MTVAFAALVLFASYVADLVKMINLHNKGAYMQKLKQSLFSVAFMIAGFLMAFVGVSNPNSAEAVAANIKEKLAFGLRDSEVEIYYATDWYCPSCKKVDPLIEELYPKLREEATFFFIDDPVHKKSMNYSPYNLSFLINNKSQYFKAREALGNLTEKTETPTDEEVKKAAKKKGITFKPLSYVDIKSGMDFFDKKVEEFQIGATPALVFSNVKNHKVIKLEGRDEITEDKVMESLEKISQDQKK